MADFFQLHREVFGNSGPQDESPKGAAMHIGSYDRRTGLDTAEDDIPELEDTNLKAHMERCRVALAQCNRSTKPVPASTIRTTLTDLTGNITTTLLDLDSAISEQGTVSDEIHILARHTEVLRSCGKATAPTFDKTLTTKDESVDSALGNIVGKLEPAAKKLENFNKTALKKLKSELSTMRHQLNSLSESCVAALESRDELIMRQREMLASAKPIIEKDRLEVEKIRREVLSGTR